MDECDSLVSFLVKIEFGVVAGQSPTEYRPHICAAKIKFHHYGLQLHSERRTMYSLQELQIRIRQQGRAREM